MKSLKLALLALALVATQSLAAPVQSVDSVGDHWVYDYNGIVDVNGAPTVMGGLSATLGFDVTDIVYDAGLNRTLLTIDITVVNTTDASIWQHATVSGIGFDTNPNVRRVGSSVTGDYSYVALNTSLPTGSGFTVEVCVSGRYNQCNGPASNATQIGQVGFASATLGFLGDWTGKTIEFSNFGIRYADLFSQQYGVNGMPGMGVPVTPPIPEPTSAALFGLGALSMGAALRRRIRG